MAINTKKPRSYPYQGRKWTLVIHGQHQSDFDKLVTFCHTDAVECAVIAREFGKNKIHPHWQIYFELFKRVNNIKTELTALLNHENFHIEKALGTKSANVRYIYAVDKYWEVGFVEYIKNVEPPHDYQDTKPNFWRNIVLRSFQQSVLEIIKNEPCDRTIHWIYEEQGNAGKTILAEYLHIFHGAIITGGAVADMQHAVLRWQEITGKNPVIMIVNLARSDRFDSASAKGIESIKDGLFFSGKYESAMVHAVNKPHVFVFANVKPDRTLFSLDRWQVWTIDHHLKLCII